MNNILEKINQIELSLLEIKKLINNQSCQEGVIQYASRKMAEMENGSFLNKGEHYAYNSIKNWDKFIKVWKHFEVYEGLNNICFEDISMNTYSSFMSFLGLKNYCKSTKYQYVTLLKAVMNYAFSEHVSSNQIQNQRNFVTRCKQEEKLKVYLTKEEIERVANFDCCSNIESKVRDVFLIGCYTGQRASDYMNISFSDIVTINIDGKAFQAFQKKQKKTGTIVIIPLIYPQVLDILTKWGGKVPYVSITSLNEIIKCICAQSGIDPIKSKQVSSHTARRSFITNLYLEGKLDTLQIRSISGHKTEESFNRYLCYSSEENAKQIMRKIAK